MEIYRVEAIMDQLTAVERLYGDYSPGRYAWDFEGPILLAEPVPYRGALGLFNVDEATLNLTFLKE